MNPTEKCKPTQYLVPVEKPKKSDAEKARAQPLSLLRNYLRDAKDLVLDVGDLFFRNSLCCPPDQMGKQGNNPYKTVVKRTPLFVKALQPFMPPVVSQTLCQLPAFSHCLAALGNGLLACGMNNGVIEVRALQTGKVVHSLFNGAGLTALLALDDGQLLSGSYGPGIKLWDTKKGTLLKTLDTQEKFAGVIYLTRLRDGKFAATLSGKEVQVWDLKKESVLRTYPRKWSTECTAEVDENLVAMGDHDERRIQIVNYQTGEPIRSLIGHQARVLCFTALSKGKLASGALDGTMKIWDTQTGECLRTIRAHKGHTSLFGPMGVTELLYTGGALYSSGGCHERILKKWDSNTGTLLQTTAVKTYGICELTAVTPNTFASVTHWDRITLWSPARQK